MEIGGLMAYAFKTFLGNPDIMIALTTWAVFLTLALVSYKVYDDLKQ